MSDERFKVDPDDANANDPRAPYVDRGPRLPRVRKAAGPLIVEREPKPEKQALPPALGPDLTQAKALARECVFSVEECERVLIVAKRDEQLARQMLHVAASMGVPDPIGEFCFGIAELKKGTP